MKDLGILLSKLDLSKKPIIEISPPAEDGMNHFYKLIK